MEPAVTALLIFAAVALYFLFKFMQTRGAINDQLDRVSKMSLEDLAKYDASSESNRSVKINEAIQKRISGFSIVEKQKYKHAKNASTRKIAEEFIKNDEKAKIELHARAYGAININLVCPHCQSKGLVRTRESTKTIKTRVNSIPAKAIGLGTNTEMAVTALRCDNCNMSWEIEH